MLSENMGELVLAFADHGVIVIFIDVNKAAAAGVHFMEADQLNKDRQCENDLRS